MKVKKLLAVALSFLLILAALPLAGVPADAATSGDYEYKVLDETAKTC